MATQKITFSMDPKIIVVVQNVYFFPWQEGKNKHGKIYLYLRLKIISHSKEDVTVEKHTSSHGSFQICEIAK